MDRCAVTGCRKTDIDVIYYDRPVCTRHWETHCDEHKRLNLKKEFRIKDKPHPPAVTDANSIPERLRRIRAMRERNRK